MKNYVMSDERKNILGHNHVVVGGFENRPEFMNKEMFYCVHLRGSSEPYFGADAQINEVAAGLLDEMMEPVKEVGRSGYMIDYPRWTFANEQGELVEVKADMVDLHQVLFEQGKLYVRTARYCFKNLKYRKPGQDWMPFSAEKASSIVMPLGEHGACSLLYVVEDEYTSLRFARKVMRQEDRFNYDNISRELFAHV